jgi:hypothetical protein
MTCSPDGKVVGRILEEGSRLRAAGAAMGMVDHGDRAGDAGRDERHRRDAGRSEREVSRCLDEGRRAAKSWPARTEPQAYP